MVSELAGNVSRSADGTSRSVEREVQRNPWIITIGRVGWVAKGVVYVLIGLLAFRIATDDGGRARGEGEASRSGAIAEISERAWGTTLLWIVAIGLILYALWRLLSALLPGDDDASAWAHRIGYLASAAIYGFLAWTAISFARHSGGSGGQTEDARIERMTRTVMENGWGRWLVGAVGVGLLCLAVYFAIKGLRQPFEDDLEPGGVGPVSESMIVLMGRIGWVARAIVVALIGFFLVRSAVVFEPDEAEGLDGALRRVAGSGWGTALVVLTGLGLIVYGAYCVLSAQRKRLSGPS